MASLSKCPLAHPPRSNPPLRSSSGPPHPCITPSTETCVVVVSFTLPSAIFDLWRKGGDSNPRDGVRPPNGFQDRRIQPLCHPSVRFMMANGAEARLRASADRDGRLYTGIPSRERWPSG